VADSSLSQESLFQDAALPIVDACLEGYNGTIFAYGQTGAGKTYTIQGSDESDTGAFDNGNSSSGIMPRAFQYIF